MSNRPDNTLDQFDALNHWLGDVYGEGTDFGTLLLDAGFSEAEIEQIKRDHLREFLQAVIDLLASYNDFSSEARKRIMIQRYGLLDGNPLSISAIGANEGIAGERIRQLSTLRLNLYRTPERQALFRHDFAAIGRRLLDNASSQSE